MSMIQDLDTAFVDLAGEGARWRGTFRFPAHLEVFEGHFPDFPMVPGVYLIGAARRVLERAGQGSWDLARVVEAKFTGVVPPETPVEVEVEVEPGDPGRRARVQVHARGERVARFDLGLRSHSSA